MGLGNNRAIKYSNESGIGNAIFGALVSTAAAAATTAIVNNPGGSGNGVQPAAIGMTLYFLDGLGETPKLISNAVNTSTQTTLTIPALAFTHAVGAKVFIDQAPATMTLLETFKIARDPKNWSPSPFTQGRSANVARVPGRQATSGSLTFMVRPTVNAGFLAKAIGQDNVSGPVSGTPLATTTTGTNNAGAAILNVTLGTGYVAGDFIQIEATGNLKSEVHKVLSATAGSITLQTGETLFYGHAPGAAVTRVVPPFVHSVPGSPAILNPIVVEDYVPYDDFSQANFLTANSYYITGLLINKLTIEGKTTDGLLATCDVIAQSKEVNAYSGFVATPSENPLFFQQEAVLAAGTVYNRVTEMKIEINNNVQVVYAKAGTSKPFAIRAGLQEVKGQFMLFEDAATQALFWANFVANTPFNLTWTTTDAASGNYVQFVMTKAVLDGFDDEDFQPGDLVDAKIPFTAYLDTALNCQITMNVANGQWLPF